MNTGRFILSLVLDLIHRQTLDRIVKRYDPTISVRHSGFRQQLTCMVFAQMTSRDGMRDIATCICIAGARQHDVGWKGLRHPAETAWVPYS